MLLALLLALNFACSACAGVGTSQTKWKKELSLLPDGPLVLAHRGRLEMRKSHASEPLPSACFHPIEVIDLPTNPRLDSQRKIAGALGLSHDEQASIAEITSSRSPPLQRQVFIFYAFALELITSNPIEWCHQFLIVYPSSFSSLL